MASPGTLDVRFELSRRCERIERALALLLPTGPEVPPSLREALHYSVLSGGKRLRPALTLACAELLGADDERVMKTACAVELVHTSSLLLDDLPCMDDHDRRRGVASTHRRFGQSTAILTSVAALCRGVELVSENAEDLGSPRERGLSAVRELCRAVGADGMCGGQELDLSAAAGADVATLKRIHRQKTAVLFAAAVSMPALLLDAPLAAVDALRRYGQALGEAFQVGDDILDSSGERPEGGIEHGNLVGLLDVTEARRLLAELTDEAKQSLAALPGRCELFVGLADVVRDRAA